MLKALLIDDEERATDSLMLKIGKFVPEIQEVHTCNDARLAAEAIRKHQPDIIFLDVRMPHLSGFDVLLQIPGKNFSVIFTTAYHEYTIQAIRFSAFDYLLKPIDVHELIGAVKRFIELKPEMHFQQQQFKNLLYNMEMKDHVQFRLAIPTREGIHFVSPRDLVRCESSGNYTRFFCTGNHQYLTAKTLLEYEEMLSVYGFIRTHKSHLVNMQYVSFLHHEGFLVMKDGSRVELSRRRKEEVLQGLKGRFH